jgi:DNA-directed RNA polymerase subunit H (RpoH/RPB5)
MRNKETGTFGLNRKIGFFPVPFFYSGDLTKHKTNTLYFSTMEHTDDQDVCLACVVENTAVMFRDRDYTEDTGVPAKLPEDLTLLTDPITKRNSSGDQCIMALVFEEVGVTTARSLVDYLGSLPAKWSLVAVANTKFTPAAGESFRDVGIEMFKTEDLSSKKRYNRMVPHNYRLLSDAERSALQDTVVDLNRLATIRVGDFVQRYYNAPVGAVFEIEVRNGQLSMRVKHRIVRDDLD